MEPKVAVVTGASRGIGKAIALELANCGMNIVVNFFKEEELAKEVAEEICKKTNAIYVKCDVSDRKQVDFLHEETISKFGRADILINCAGVIKIPGDWANIGDIQWDRTFDVNLKGKFNCIKKFAPIFLEQQYGKIINIASTYGIFGAAPVVAYAAAKAGVLNLTKSFAKELAPHVTVNSVAPGNIDTDMTRGAGPDLIKMIVESTPLKRLGQPEDVAYMVSFLASEKADFITGQTFIVDGGHFIA